MGVDIVLLSSLKCYVVGMVVGSEHGLWSQMHGVQIPTAELGVSVSAWACYLIFFLSLFPQGGKKKMKIVTPITCLIHLKNKCSQHSAWQVVGSYKIFVLLLLSLSSVDFNLTDANLMGNSQVWRELAG